MAPPVTSPLVLLLLLLLLLASPPTPSSSADWAQQLGSDMLPEKSCPLESQYPFKAEPQQQNDAPHPVIEPQDVPRHVEQLQLLIHTQQNQLERLERLVELLQQSIDKLRYEFLRPPDRNSGGGSSFRRAGKEIGAEEDTDFDSVPGDEDTRFLRETIGTPEIQSDAAPLGGVWSGKEVPGERKDSRKTPEIGNLGRASNEMQRGPSSVRGRAGYGYGGTITVARYKPAWSEHFQFLSAVKVDGEVTSLHVLPHDGEEGLSKYVAVGAASGRVYIFLTHGDLLVDFTTNSSSSITVMLSFSIRKNETILVTGHSDGSALVHRIWETTHSNPSFGDDWPALTMEYVQSLVVPKHRNGWSEDDMEPQRNEAGGNPITILEVYRVGKMRYVLMADSEGKIQVFRENGTFYGMAESSSRPLAFLRSPNTQRLLFLTQTGAASLDLRSMTVRNGPCEGLNGTSVVAYAFDAAGRSKAYGFTEDGDMIYVALSGDTLHFECHVRTKKKLEIEGPLTPHGIKGYLLVATSTQFFVYNTTLQVGFGYANILIGGARPLFSTSLDDISASFSSNPVARIGQPVMACNREKLVVVGFGDGYIGVYKSNLPVQRPSDFNAKVWSSPVFISILVLLGAWQFFGRKKEITSTWSSEVPLASSSTTVPAYVRTGLGETRDSHRESRRFSSPSRAFTTDPNNYSGGTLKFRTSAVEQSFRTSTVEPSFRPSTVEPSSYSARREPFFSSTQTVGEETLR